MKGPPLQLTAEEYAIKLSVLKLCLRDGLDTRFELGLLIVMPSFFKYLTSQII